MKSDLIDCAVCLHAETVPPHWPWIPVTEDSNYSDYRWHGGYWKETEEDRASRESEILSYRHGYCVLAGKP